MHGAHQKNWRPSRLQAHFAGYRSEDAAAAPPSPQALRHKPAGGAGQAPVPPPRPTDRVGGADHPLALPRSLAALRMQLVANVPAGCRGALQRHRQAQHNAFEPGHCLRHALSQISSATATIAMLQAHLTLLRSFEDALCGNSRLEKHIVGSIDDVQLSLPRLGVSQAFNEIVAEYILHKEQLWRRLTQRQMVIVAIQMRSFCFTKTLDLRHRGLGAAHMAPLLTVLAPMDALMALNLAHNQIDDGALNILLDGLPAQHAKLLLRLDGNPLGAAGEQRLSAYRQAHHDVRALARGTRAEADALAVYEEQTGGMLRTCLDRLRRRPGPLQTITLNFFLSTNCLLLAPLECLDLSHVHFSCDALVFALNLLGQRARNLQSLSLAATGIDDTWLATVLPHLGQFPALRQLNMGHNPLGSRGLVQLAIRAGMLPSLLVLNLDGIADVRARELERAVCARDHKAIGKTLQPDAQLNLDRVRSRTNHRALSELTRQIYAFDADGGIDAPSRAAPQRPSRAPPTARP